jgi:hypothetical protein
MNCSDSLGVLATLREVTDLLANLDLADLPQISNVNVTPDFEHSGLSGQAQLRHASGADLDKIDAIRAWAVALGGVTLLADAHYSTSGRHSYRQLAAIVPLTSGGVFEVWTHLTELAPSPGWTPADAVRIPLDVVA